MESSQLAIENLDDDVLLAIFSLLDFTDKVRLGLVCKRWKDLSDYLLSMQTCLYFSDKNDFDVELSCPESSYHFKSTEYIELSKILIEDGFLKYLEKDGWNEVRSEIMHKALTMCPNLKRIGLMDFLQLESPIQRIIDLCDSKNLEAIDVIGFKKVSLTVEEMQIVGLKFPSLKWLRVVSSTMAIAEESLMALFISCPNLQVLVAHSNLLYPPSWTTWGREGQYHMISGECYSFLTNIKKISTDVRILDNSGLICLAAGDGGRNLTNLDLSGSVFDAWWLQIICQGLTQLIKLRCSKISVFSEDDLEDITLISHLSNLEELYLDLASKNLRIYVDDTFFNIMQGCRRMRKFQMFNGYVSDRSLVEINKFWPNLVHLSLHTMQMNPEITDFSASSIAQLVNLYYLNLNGTNIGDGMVEVLERCSCLKDVNLEYTLVTINIVNVAIAMAKRRPNDQIVFDLAGNNINIPENLPSNLTIYQ